MRFSRRKSQRREVNEKGQLLSGKNKNSSRWKKRDERKMKKDGYGIGGEEKKRWKQKRKEKHVKK